MHGIDLIHTDYPMYGWPKVTQELHARGYQDNHKRVYRLMKVMGVEALYPKRNLSKPGPEHLWYPYLLKDTQIIKPNQVWGVDITYIRLRKDWLYLIAVIDWYSRFIVAWELSDNLRLEFCLRALEKALQIGIPGIHNSDQGSHFTSGEYLGILKRYPDIRISMDHRGRCFDNIFTERFWRSLKYEEVYVKSYENPREAEQSIGKYIEFYNWKRFHQSLGYQTPAAIYFKN